jgi:hypothetical protein
MFFSHEKGLAYRFQRLGEPDIVQRRGGRGEPRDVGQADDLGERQEPRVPLPQDRCHCIRPRDPDLRRARVLDLFRDTQNLRQVVRPGVVVIKLFTSVIY